MQHCWSTRLPHAVEGAPPDSSTLSFEPNINARYALPRTAAYPVLYCGTGEIRSSNVGIAAFKRVNALRDSKYHQTTAVVARRAGCAPDETEFGLDTFVGVDRRTIPETLDADAASPHTTPFVVGIYDGEPPRSRPAPVSHSTETVVRDLRKLCSIACTKIRDGSGRLVRAGDPRAAFGFSGSLRAGFSRGRGGIALTPPALAAAPLTRLSNGRAPEVERTGDGRSGERSGMFQLGPLAGPEDRSALSSRHTPDHARSNGPLPHSERAPAGNLPLPGKWYSRPGSNGGPPDPQSAPIG